MKDDILLQNEKLNGEPHTVLCDKQLQLYVLAGKLDMYMKHIH